MTLRNLRRVVLVVCVVGIAGMIVSSIVGSTGGAITFGLLTAVAILCSIVATAVVNGPPGQRAAERAADSPGGARVTEPARDGEEIGQDVEVGVRALVDAGADEAAVRRLVRDAVRFGRSIR